MKRTVFAAILWLCATVPGCPSPTLKLAPRAMAGDSGHLAVRAFLGGAQYLNGAEVHIRYDAAKVSVVPAAGTFTPGPGWSTAAFSVQNGEIVWVGTAGGLENVDGAAIVTIALRAARPGDSALTLTTASSVADEGFEVWPVTAEQSVTFPFTGAHAPPSLQLVRQSWTEVAAVADLGMASNLTAAEVRVQFDPALVSIDPATAIPGTGWQQSSFAVTGTGAVWKGVHTTGTYTDGAPIVRIPLNRLSMGPVTLTLTTASSVSDESGVPALPEANQPLALSAKAPSRLYLVAGGARTGDCGVSQVLVTVGDSRTLTDAEIHLQFDPQKLSVLDSATSFMPGSGWEQTGFTVADGEAVWKGHYTGGAAVTAPLLSVHVWRLVDGDATVTLTAASAVADETRVRIHPEADQVASYGTQRPTRIHLDPGMAPIGQPGQFRVLGDPAPGHAITGAEIHLKFDRTKVTVNMQDFVAGPGWTIADWNVLGDEAIWAGANVDGLTEPGAAIVTIKATPVAPEPATVTLTTQSNIADEDFNAWYIPQPQTSTLLPGRFRDLYDGIMGAPSVGPGGTLAVVVGQTLRLLNASDLSDVAGFAPVPLAAQCEGRPAFGMVGGVPAVAVGTTAGDLFVVSTSTGAHLRPTVRLGSGLGTPAIDSASGAIYVGANQPTGNALMARVASDGSVSTAPLEGDRITSSPAFLGGCVVVGTNAAASLFRVTGDGSLVPQATLADPNGFTTSPVVRAVGTGMITADGNVYQFDVVRGVIATGHLALNTRLAEGWYDYATDAWYYGGSNGHVFQIGAGVSGPSLVKDTPVSTRAIGAQVMGLDSRIYAVDSSGGIAFDKGGAFSFRGSSTRALAATGRGGSLIVSDVRGGIASLPF